MSQTLAASSGARAGRGPARLPARGPARPPRPSLRVVAAPVAERGRTAFVLGALALLVAGLVTLLMVNTALAQGSFRMHDLRARSGELADQSQALREDIALQASPQRLSSKAAALGMVPSGSVAFLRLSDGRVLGVAQPAAAPPAPTVTTGAPTVSNQTRPAPTAKPKPKPKPKTKPKTKPKPTTTR